MANSQLTYGTNAWIFLNEDEPSGTDYNSPNSCYQSLIKNDVYKRVNFLGLAFFQVTDASGSGSTIEIGNGSHPNGLTNQDYLDYILRDARKVNPNIKFLATMGYGDNSIGSIFKAGGDEATEAQQFAKNLVTYLKANGMNGIDIDWESPLSNKPGDWNKPGLITKSQFEALFKAIRKEFDAETVKYYLSFTPAWPTATMDATTINDSFDFVSPQFYDGIGLDSFLDAGISPSLIGYGAQFEPGNSAPNASAQQVWSQVSGGFSHSGTNYDYQDIIMWRFNSNNFQFEQAQFMILNELVYPSTSSDFDDSQILNTAGNPQITQMTVHSGEVLNAVQNVNTGNGTNNFGTQPAGTTIGIFTLPQHGDNSGGSHSIDIPLDDPIVSISGYTGVWYGWSCVLQLTLTGKSGKTYGTFGTMNGSTSKTPFTQSAPDGQSVVCFKGSTVVVPLADGSHTAIIASLDAVFG